MNQQLKDGGKTTNQGVVGSIPASRTKRKTLEQQCSRVFSFVHQKNAPRGAGSHSTTMQGWPSRAAYRVKNEQGIYQRNRRR